MAAVIIANSDNQRSKLAFSNVAFTISYYNIPLSKPYNRSAVTSVVCFP